MRVHLYSTAPGTWLEVRPRQEKTVPWRRVCLAPCDESVDLEGQELRAAGDTVTPSNPIRVEGGTGTLRLSVDAGSSRARALGLGGIFVGVPVAMAGGAIFGLAKTTDVSHADAFATIGLVTVVVGGVISLASLPLLASGTTAVRNEAGTVVGSTPAPTFTY